MKKTLYILIFLLSATTLSGQIIYYNDTPYTGGGGTTMTAQQISDSLDVLYTPTWRTQKTVEEIQDIIGAMFTGGTHTNITVNYNDVTGVIDLSGSAGGTSNPNATNITTLADLQGITANKIGVVEGDIDLGTATVNLPAGVTLDFATGGGSLTNGTLVGDGRTGIIANPYEQIFSPTLIGIGFKVARIYAEWWGAQANNSNLFDNAPFIQAMLDFDVANNVGVSDLSGGGDYYVAMTGNTDKDRPSLKIYSNTIVEIYNKTKVRSIINAFSSSTLIAFFEAENSALIGFNDGSGFQGTFSENPALSEFHTGIKTMFRCRNITIKGVDISYFRGDGINQRTQFGWVGNPAAGTDFESGGINISTGAPEIDATKIRGIATWDLTATLFSAANNRQVDGYSRYGEFTLSGGGFSEFVGVKEGKYDVFFYDLGDAFVGYLQNLEMYDPVSIPATATKARLVLRQTETTYTDTAGVVQNVAPRIQADEITVGLKIIDNNIHHNCRNNISGTGAARVLVENNDIHHADGTLPEAGIDIEDYYEGNKNWTVKGNRFWSNGLYDFITVRSWKTVLENNDFLYRDKKDVHLATIGMTGPDNISRYNNVDWGTVTVNDNSTSQNNKYRYSRVNLVDGTMDGDYFLNGMLVTKDNDNLNGFYIKKSKSAKNLVFENTLNKFDITGFRYSVLQESDELEPSFFENIKIKGDADDRWDQIRSQVSEVRNYRTVNQLIAYNKVNTNIEAPSIISYAVPSNNETIILSNVKTSDLRFRGVTTNLHNIRLDNVRITATDIAIGNPAIDFDEPFGKVIITNSAIIDTTTTLVNWELVNFDQTVEEFVFKDNIVETATAGNLVNIGTSTAVDFVYQDNDIKTTVLNSRPSDKTANNVIDGILQLEEGGKTVLNGTVEPTTEGVDGDFYINTTSSTIFGPKTAGAWGSGTSLVGATGASGADGVVDGIAMNAQSKKALEYLKGYKTPNYFNKNDLVDGYFANNTASVLTAPTTDEKVSGKIYLSAGDYAFYGIDAGIYVYVARYDLTGAYISTYEFFGTGTRSFNMPQDGYVQFDVNRNMNTLIEDIVLSDYDARWGDVQNATVYGNPNAEYEPYFSDVPSLQLELTDNLINLDSIIPVVVAGDDVELVIRVDVTGGETVSIHDTFSVYDTTRRLITEYDATNTLIGSYVPNVLDQIYKKHTLQPTTAYFYINFWRTNDAATWGGSFLTEKRLVENLRVNIGEYWTQEKQAYRVKFINNLEIPKEENALKALKIALFGDSITTASGSSGSLGSYADEFYQDYECVVRNYANGSAGYTDWFDTAVTTTGDYSIANNNVVSNQIEYMIAQNYMPDIIFLTGLTNDAFRSRVVGNLATAKTNYSAPASQDKETVYGMTFWAHKRIKDFAPNAKIVVLLPIESIPNVVAGFSAHNGNLDPLRDGLQLAAEELGMEIFSFKNRLNNLDEPVPNEDYQDYLHPNVSAKRKMFKMILPIINNFLKAN